MSWLARSFAPSFREGESSDEEEKKIEERSAPENDPGRGMKEDFSELTRSFTKQLWGVASFLAPPPAADAAKPPPADLSAPGSNPLPSVPSEILQLEPADRAPAEARGRGEASPSEEATENAPGLEGIRSDFAEIKTGISRFSSKLASNLLPFKRESDAEEEEDEYEEEEEEEEEDEEDEKVAFDEERLKSAAGVTDEVLTFARNISMHPETWLDFPLFADEDDLDDFDMSDAQREHASAIERLAPRLAALRIELCPGYMSEGRFWKIYFVLLHSRLNKKDALLLSTPQIVEARGLLLQELQSRTKAEPGNIGSDMAYSEEKGTLLPQEHAYSKQSNILDKNERIESFKIVSLQAATPMAANDFQTDDQAVVTSTQRGYVNDQVLSDEPSIQNKTVLSGTVKLSEHKYEDDEEEMDDWLEEEPTGMDVPVCNRTGLENEDDVSFSDLEEEEDVNVQATSSNVKESFRLSPKGTKGWVQLDKSGNYIAEASTSRNSSVEGSSQSDMSLKSDSHILHSREASTEQQTKKLDSGESSDWLTVEDDDVVSADSS